MRQEPWGFHVSDWELYTENNESNPKTPSSEWETLTSPEKPSFGQALAQAPGKIYEDFYNAVTKFGKKIPDYYEASKTEIPGIFSSFKNDPFHATAQQYAGLAELGQNVFNSPHNLINYLSSRLNLVPEDFNKIVQMGRMPDDTQQFINQRFGEPNQPGEKLLRGLSRNALNLVGAKGAASMINPMNLSSYGIARNVLKETQNQIDKHSKKYNNIWTKAEKSGFNQVPIDKNLLTSNHSLIDKFYPEKSTDSLKTFLEKPTLQNAQSAQSDIGNLKRVLEDKSKTAPLLETEKSLLNTLSQTEKHIEKNMFKNEKGRINRSLQDNYAKVTDSYRKNVVPYRYNDAIQAYKSKKITAPELVNALSRGEFARQKGFTHPAIKINKLFPYLAPAGIGLMVGRELFGKKESNTFS